MFHANAENTRECSDCSCSSPTQGCSDGSLLLFGGPDCTGEPLQEMELLNPGYCDIVNAVSFVADFGADEACSVTTAPEPTGSATAAGAFTFCCG